MASNALIGFATGYEWKDLYPFVKSLPDKKVLFVGSISNYTKDILENEHNCWLVPVNDVFPYVPEYIGDVFIRDFRHRKLHLMCWRFLAIYSFLKTHGEEFENVCLTDVRDAAGANKGTLFDFPWDNLNVFAEYDKVKVKDCGYNSQWMKAFFGEAEYQKVKDNNIICGGTILGRVPNVLALIEHMMNEFRRTDSRYVGCDQAALIKLVYGGYPAKVWQWDESPICTVGQIKDGSRIDLTNVKYVHQWDRPWLTELKNEIWKQF